jgi:hypothetical protein
MHHRQHVHLNTGNLGGVVHAHTPERWLSPGSSAVERFVRRLVRRQLGDRASPHRGIV